MSDKVKSVSFADWFIIVFTVTLIAIAWLWIFLSLLPSMAPLLTSTKSYSIGSARDNLATTSQVTGTVAGFLIVAFVFLLEKRKMSLVEKRFFDRNSQLIWLGISMAYFLILSLASLVEFQELTSYQESTILVTNTLPIIEFLTWGAAIFAFAGFSEIVLKKIWREFYGIGAVRKAYERRTRKS